MADPPWCERASKALYDKRVLQSGSPDFYYPRSIIVQVFQDFAIRELFLCGCERCRRHSLVAFGATDLASVFEDIESKLLGDYLTTYALLVSIDRPAFIGLFISEGVRLDGNHFLDATDLDFLALVSAPQVQDRVLREQWKFQIRPLAVTEDPMNYLPKEVLPIRYGEEIGRGQFGIVYKAFFPFPEYQGAGLKGLELPPLACKVFNCDNFELGLKEWGNHLHVNQKDHPNFMRALGAFTHGCDFCIIFPYAESTLEKQLQSDFPGLSSEAICKQMLDIVKAVDCLHGDNDRTIHSDLKPQNILVMNGMFKVADFGSLRLVEEIKDSKIRYVMVGRDYSPPESTIESPSYDIWSLAAILSEVFTADLQKRETLMRFRRERKAEDEDFVNSECFHKAKQLKLAVSTRFEELLDLVEKSKSGKGEKLSAWQERFYTRTLFDLLKDMLSPQGSGRPPASEVARKLSDLIHKASHIEVEQPSEVDIWRLLRERALPGDSPRPHLKFCATSAIDGADQRRRRCVLYFHRQFKPSRLSITRYHFDKDSKLVAVELYVSRRGSGHKVNNIEREVTGFYPSHLHPEEINLVFRDGHEDSYRLQSKIDALSLQGELTGLLVHNKLSFESPQFWFDRNRTFFSWPPFRRQDPIQVYNVRYQIWTDRAVTRRAPKTRGVQPSQLNMKIAVLAKISLFLIYVSHDAEETVNKPPIADTTVILKHVSVREMNLSRGIPINVYASHDYKPNQEVQLYFSNKSGRDEFLSELKIVYGEWERSREHVRQINQDQE